MNDKVTQPKKYQPDAEFRKILEELSRKPRPWSAIKTVWYLVLASIGAACVLGTLWLLLAFLERWV